MKLGIKKVVQHVFQLLQANNKVGQIWEKSTLENSSQICPIFQSKQMWGKIGKKAYLEFSQICPTKQKT